MQHISTAPDNQRILLTEKYLDEVFIGIKTGNICRGSIIGVECSGGWDGCTVHGEIFSHLTHWQPLPEKPKDSNE